MTDCKQLPGKFIWFELVSRDVRKAQAFYGEVLGWRVVPFPMGGFTYDMAYVGDTMIGGYAEPRDAAQPSHWVSYVSVEDADASVKAATASGGRVVEPAVDLPTVGRIARIADPLGAELCLFDKATDDPPDGPTTQGHWMWNELHTPDPARVLPFYEKVVGFSHRALGMGPSGTYHVISRGGVDRGGVTDHLAPGQPAHWLPYVYVDDCDATVARARKLGGKIPVDAMDIPGIGRFGVLEDPSGAVLAVMKPAPMEKQP